MARFLGALVLCLAVAVFAVENNQAVHLVFLGLTAPAVRLSFLILASLVLGAAVTVLLGGLQVLRLRRHIVGVERDLQAARAGFGAAPAELDSHAASAALSTLDDAAADGPPASTSSAPAADYDEADPERPPDRPT
jgi:lipopolysaccharide assembly protein A